MPKLTQERLKEALSYDPDTGVFVWRVKRQGRRKDKVAGTISSEGYRKIFIDGKQYQASRLSFLFMEGRFPEYEVDHINRKRSDDRWDNLRHVSSQCNSRNCGIYKNNTSGVKGVYWNRNRKRWYVQIMVNRKCYYLGEYKNFENAVCARLAGEQCLNWSGCDSSSPAFQYVKNLLA